MVKQKIIYALFSELATGGKHPNQIESLKLLKSDESRYRLLRELTEKNTLIKTTIGYHTKYQLNLDQALLRAIRESLKAQEMLEPTLIALRSLQLEKSKMVYFIMAFLLKQLSTFVSAFEKLATYPEPQQLIVRWLFDSFLERFKLMLQTFGSSNSEATDQALNEVKDLLNKTAEEFRHMAL